MNFRTNSNTGSYEFPQAYTSPSTGQGFNYYGLTPDHGSLLQQNPMIQMYRYASQAPIGERQPLANPRIQNYMRQPLYELPWSERVQLGTMVAGNHPINSQPSEFDYMYDSGYPHIHGGQPTNVTHNLQNWPEPLLDMPIPATPPGHTAPSTPNPALANSFLVNNTKFTYETDGRSKVTNANQFEALPKTRTSPPRAQEMRVKPQHLPQGVQQNQQFWITAKDHKTIWALLVNVLQGISQNSCPLEDVDPLVHGRRLQRLFHHGVANSKITDCFIEDVKKFLCLCWDESDSNYGDREFSGRGKIRAWRYPCPFEKVLMCSKVVDESHRLREHLLNSHKEWPKRCNICNSLLRHGRDTHRHSTCKGRAVPVVKRLEYKQWEKFPVPTRKYNDLCMLLLGKEVDTHEYPKRRALIEVPLERDGTPSGSDSRRTKTTSNGQRLQDTDITREKVEELVDHKVRRISKWLTGRNQNPNSEKEFELETCATSQKPTVLEQFIDKAGYCVIAAYGMSLGSSADSLTSYISSQPTSHTNSSLSRKGRRHDQMASVQGNYPSHNHSCSQDFQGHLGNVPSGLQTQSLRSATSGRNQSSKRKMADSPHSPSQSTQKNRRAPRPRPQVQMASCEGTAPPSAGQAEFQRYSSQTVGSHDSSGQSQRRRYSTSPRNWPPHHSAGSPGPYFSNAANNLRETERRPGGSRWNGGG